MIIKLIEGDCLEKMDDLESNSIDLILCDPPYGTIKQVFNWDNVLPFDLMWIHLERLIKRKGAIVLSSQQPFTASLISSNVDLFKYCWYWEKERLTNINQVKRRPGKTIEEFCVFYKEQPTYNPQMIIHEGPLRSNKVKNGRLGKISDSGQKKVKEYVDNGIRYPTQILKFKRDCLTSNLHPTQKPIKLLEYLIKTYTNENDLVLDFTMGSGSTGIACKNLNRNFIGIELDENYFEIASNRIKNHIPNLI